MTTEVKLVVNTQDLLTASKVLLRALADSDLHARIEAQERLKEVIERVEGKNVR